MTTQDSDELGLPWTRPTRQVEGRQVERETLKRMGARAHPNSGAGKIKHDGSDEDRLIEVKLANKVYSLKARELEELMIRAFQQGKDPVFVIEFDDPRITIEATVRRRQ